MRSCRSYPAKAAVQMGSGGDGGGLGLPAVRKHVYEPIDGLVSNAGRTSASQACRSMAFSRAVWYQEIDLSGALPPAIRTAKQPCSST